MGGYHTKLNWGRYVTEGPFVLFQILGHFPANLFFILVISIQLKVKKIVELHDGDLHAVSWGEGP